VKGPSFEELIARGERFRATYDLTLITLAVNAWHDCVGHSLFAEFTPPTLEGELLAGRHQHLVLGGSIAEVLEAAPAKFMAHLGRTGLVDDPDALARKDALLARLEAYLHALPAFENLSDYNDPFFDYLKRQLRLS
jgi:hypothetical protein